MYRRDISVVDLCSNSYLILACDSAGGIGPKKEDVLNVPGRIVGKFVARVALMEVMAVGAKPVNLSNALAVEYDPTGKDIIAGIKEEVHNAGLNLDIVNGSTEENFETVQTGVGVTVSGICEKARLKMAVSQKDDLIIAIGLPMVGQEVLQNEEQIADLNVLSSLLKLDYIHEILPVGSKGIIYEADVLAGMSGYSCQFYQNKEIDFKKSAGPGTTLLVSLAESNYAEVTSLFDKPITIIGRLKI